MSTPEALRLAGVLERMPLGEVDQMAADMLRAQSAEIERLTAALDEARAERSVAYLAFEQVTKERDALREALAEADRLAGHDDAMTEWRERCAHLWDDAARAQKKENGNG